MNRRDFGKTIAVTGGLAGLGLLGACGSSESTQKTNNKTENSKELSEKMYQRALQITKEKIRGGEDEPFFKKPFVDAAFSQNIFLWDTCFIVCFAKYHLAELPVYQALDNFYERADDDGFICREYRQDGRPLWPKEHPVSINPPLFAFAELEVFSVSKDTTRLKKVYPVLKKNFQFLVDKYQLDDGLFYADSLGMGMDNIPRTPRDWKPETGSGLTESELWAKIGSLNLPPEKQLDMFSTGYKDTVTGVWEKQGRFIDFSAQMAMYAIQLIEIANLIGNKTEVAEYEAFHDLVKNAINEKCWNEKDGFYYDLGFDEQIPRKHIGAYWTLLGRVVPDNLLERFLEKLTDPNEFYRTMPLPAISASDPDFKGWGDYWLGGVWAPTSYMVIKGLEAVGKMDLAVDLAEKTYQNVARVFEATETFWENYSPDLISYGMPARKDFCGWTGLIPIAVYREFLEGKK
jgi:hypothetical protein